MTEENITTNSEKLSKLTPSQEEINSIVMGLTDFFEILIKIDRNVKKGADSYECS